MKKKIAGITIVTVMAVVAILNARAGGDKVALSDLAMENIDALAQDESTEKKFRYTTFGEKCTIYVGGAYATGEKVTCLGGSDHPVCVDCKL